MFNQTTRRRKRKKRKSIIYWVSFLNNWIKQKKRERRKKSEDLKSQSWLNIFLSLSLSFRMSSVDRNRKKDPLNFSYQVHQFDNQIEIMLNTLFVDEE